MFLDAAGFPQTLQVTGTMRKARLLDTDLLSSERWVALLCGVAAPALMLLDRRRRIVAVFKMLAMEDVFFGRYV